MVETRGFASWGFGLSAALHAIASLALLSRANHPTREAPRLAVSFEVRALPPSVKPAALPEPRPLPPRAIPERTRPSRVPRRETPEERPPPSEPIDLSGITLTDPGSGAGFSVSAGDGSSRPAAFRFSAPARSPAPPTVVSAAATRAPAPAADLSERPKPPALDAVLKANYPPSKQQLGIEGEASVRVQIDPDGRVRTASVVQESEAGFGAACRKTVLGSIWSPALDRERRRVATAVTYRCRFRIDR